MSGDASWEAFTAFLRSVRPETAQHDRVAHLSDIERRMYNAARMEAWR